jgi:hypothetical protein
MIWEKQFMTNATTKTVKRVIPAILFAALLFTSSIPVNSQSNIDKALIREAEKITKDQFPFTAKSKKGAKIFSRIKVDQKTLDAIDSGLADLFAIAEKHKYSKRTKYSDYNIFIAKADRKKDSYKNYSPDIAVSAGQYAGSDYDQGGFIYAAGMVLAYTPCAFVIAEHDKDFQRVSDVVRFEGEHIILYHNDRKLYNETADHSKSGGHPILK